ncbi:Elongator complex protein 4 [Liparis tanakae]|uniref:Elongator complex protein 4 n=1 Tax=Liparis tanakae TaxID=230148 RepID=A0A4Z2GQT6_9TELE|nr:Elongator complex protein 4 [Liparis tanakae]
MKACRCQQDAHIEPDVGKHSEDRLCMILLLRPVVSCPEGWGYLCVQGEVSEEDRYDSYSRMILKYFLAEGVVCRHELFVAAAQDNPDDILQELPAPILDDVAIHKPVEQPRLSCEAQDSLDAMKIAWRYQNLPKVQSALASSSRFGHYYDVSKTMEPEIRQAAKCHCFYLPEHPAQPSATRSATLESYSALLKSLQEVINREGFDVAAPMSKSRNILRIGLHSLGSALWGDDLSCHDNPRNGHALTTFLYGLRALLRSSLSVAVVTVPSHLIQMSAVVGAVPLSLSGLASKPLICPPSSTLGSGVNERGKKRRGGHFGPNQVLDDEANTEEQDELAQTTPDSLSIIKQLGKLSNSLKASSKQPSLMHVRQIPHLNCLASKLPDHKDLAFKLKRKQFTIETVVYDRYTCV